MRCPKCGYISFDHLEKCLKCKKDILQTSSSLYGSIYNIEAPTFLRMQPQSKDDSLEDEDFLEELSDDDVGVEAEAYVDEDLEILMDTEDADSEGETTFDEDGEPQLELSAEESREEEGEIEIDFSQFKDDNEVEAGLFGEIESELEAETDADVDEYAGSPIAQLSPAFDIPEELEDMSDLAPPAGNFKAGRYPSQANEDPEMLDLELDDLQFDLGLDDMDDSVPKKGDLPEEAMLALDEIDFSETLAESTSGGSKKIGYMDMDEDLNFDLDLGGLSIHKDL